MECRNMNELITMYIDDVLDEHTRELIDKHLSECESCMKEYQEILFVIEACKELPQLDLPTNFEIDLHKKLTAAANEVEETVISPIGRKQPNSKKKINWRIYASVAAVFVILALSITSFDLNGQKGTQSEQKMEQETAYAGNSTVPQATMAEGAFTIGATELKDFNLTTESNNNVAVQDGQNQITQVNGDFQTMVVQTTSRKIIKSAYLNIDIEKYDEKLDLIMRKANEYGGYIETSNTEYKYFNPDQMEESLKRGNITIRIPEAKFMNMVEEIKTVGTVTNFGVNGQDITSEYRDTVNEVENLKIQEQRLREIMEKANVVKDVLEIERELTRVRGELNRLTGNIKKWDELTSLSTIQVALNEVVPKDKKVYPVSDNVWEKVRKGFISTINDMVRLLENILIGVASILPILIILSLIGLPMVGYLLKRKK